jgi:predicted HNH restriction endonuclease
MRKFLVISIPIVTLILFILFMISGSMLKQSFGEDDNIPKSIEIVIQDIDSENWEAASKSIDQLSRAWEKVLNRVQFSSERNEINDLSISLARLRGAIKAQDKSGGLEELYEAYEHWRDLGQ